MYKDCKIKKEYTSITDEKAFATAKDIKISSKGISFILIVENNEIECKTKLLGKHNLNNILMCAALAYKLGLSLKQIQLGISKL